MGASSQQGTLAIRTQTARGTYASDIGTAGVAMRRRSGGMAGNRELMVPDAEIGGNRDVPDALLGPGNFTGELEFYGRFKSIGVLLKGALGGATSVTATGVTTHTFTPSDLTQLPFMSIYERTGAAMLRAQYTDAVFNTLHFEAEPSGYFAGTVGVLAARQLMDVPDVDVTSIIDETTLTVGTNITVMYDGADVKAKGFSFDLTNNFEDDDYRLGSFYLEDLTPKRREVTGSITLRHENSSMMKAALLGSASATALGGLTTKKPIVINISTYQDIPGGTPATRYSLSLTLPNTVFEPFSFEPSGDDILESELSFRALRPSNATPVMTAVLKNDAAALA